MDGYSSILFPPWPWFAQIFLCFDRSSQMKGLCSFVEFWLPHPLLLPLCSGSDPIAFLHLQNSRCSLLAQLAFVSGGRALLWIFMSFKLPKSDTAAKGWWPSRASGDSFPDGFSISHCFTSATRERQPPCPSASTFRRIFFATKKRIFWYKNTNLSPRWSKFIFQMKSLEMWRQKSV